VKAHRNRFFSPFYVRSGYLH